MKLLVIGATRGIGRCLLDHGLDQGHEVSALVRKPDRFENIHNRLSLSN